MKKSIRIISISLIFLFFSCQDDEDFTNINKETIPKLKNTMVSGINECDELTEKYNYSKPSFKVEVREDLIWGVNGHSIRRDGSNYDNPYYGDVSYEETVAHLKKLGAKIYRNDIHVVRSGDLNSNEKDEDLDMLLNVLASNDIQLLPMLYTSQHNQLLNFTDDNFQYENLKNLIYVLPSMDVINMIEQTRVWNENYNWAFETGKNFAIKRGESLKYYNVGNENAFKVISRIGHPNNTEGIKNDIYFYDKVGSGGKIADFFETEEHAKKTVAGSAFTKGMIDGIKLIDSDAKCIVNDTRAHFGYFKFLNLMNVDYDIIGWNWYSSFGEITNTSQNNDIHGIETGSNVYEELNIIGSGKPLWITEVNRTRGSGVNGNFEDQANDIRSSMENMYQLSNIKAYIVYELLDGSNNHDPNEDNFGLITNPRLDYELKPAFNTYRYSIEELNYGYHDFVYSYYTLYRGDRRNLVGNSGIDYWSSRLIEGLSIPDFLNAVMDLDSGNFIELTYKLLLDRSSDASGKAYYLSRLQDGLSREWLIASMASSESFFDKAQSANYYNSHPTNNFVYHVYNKLLKRNPFQNELINESLIRDIYLNSRDLRVQFVSDILYSEEYKRLFINDQYNNYLNRNADSSGLEYHISNWSSQKKFLIYIMNSSEFWRKSVIRGYCKRQL